MNQLSGPNSIIFPNNTMISNEVEIITEPKTKKTRFSVPKELLAPQIKISDKQIIDLSSEKSEIEKPQSLQRPYKVEIKKYDLIHLFLNEIPKKLNKIKLPQIKRYYIKNSNIENPFNIDLLLFWNTASERGLAIQQELEIELEKLLEEMGGLNKLIDYLQINLDKKKFPTAMNHLQAFLFEKLKPSLKEFYQRQRNDSSAEMDESLKEKLGQLDLFDKQVLKQKLEELKSETSFEIKIWS